MLWMIAARLAVGPTPVPTPTSNVPDDAVTPGVWGFTITAIVGVVVILLILDMVRRLRRLNYRAEIRERLEAEEAATAVPPTGPGSGAGSAT